MPSVWIPRHAVPTWVTMVTCWWLAWPAVTMAQDTLDERVRRLEEVVAALQQNLAAKDRQIADLSTELTRLKTSQAELAAVPAGERLPDTVAVPAPRTDWELPMGNATARLIDISAVLNTSVGGSSVSGETLEALQGGGHDPRRRGFNLNQLELSIAGAVDPFFSLEGHLVYTEDGVELEEAFATTTSLPADLQLEVGYFLTEFGRINPMHPHSWDWLDQPVINTRLFGGDGMRGAGARLSWLAPVPWYSELSLGVQNADGESMASFNGEGLHHHHDGEEEHAETIGGRPIVDREVSGLGDLVYLVRWANGFDASDAVSAQLGVSGLFGPNNTGRDGRTAIYGADLVFKYQPPGDSRRRPLLTWQTEVMKRHYKADGVTVDDGMGGTLAFPADTLADWGFYTQVLHNLNNDWSWGLRYEYASGSGDSYDEAASVVDREDDPFRDNRQRVSPLLVYHPSEFTRLRLQYNYDRASHLDSDDAHSLWLGFEFLIGSHPAHSY